MAIKVEKRMLIEVKRGELVDNKGGQLERVEEELRRARDVDVDEKAEDDDDDDEEEN